MSSLIESFSQYFEVVDADTPELLQEVFRLRYQVLCIEEQVPDFEPEKFPDGLERDEFDWRSVHSLLRERSSGAFVGTVRLILCNPRDPREPFPIEKYTANCFDPRLINPTTLPRCQTAEISRFIVARSLRKRRHDLAKNYSTPAVATAEKSIVERRRFPYPFLGLLAAVMRMTSAHGVTHWYGGMDPALNRQLAKLGVELQAVGPLVKYHGIRQPHFSSIAAVAERAYYRNRDTWELLTAGGRLWPAPNVRCASAHGG